MKSNHTRGFGRIATTLALALTLGLAGTACDPEELTDSPQMGESEGAGQALGEEASEADGDRKGDGATDDKSPGGDAPGAFNSSQTAPQAACGMTVPSDGWSGEASKAFLDSFTDDHTPPSDEGRGCTVEVQIGEVYWPIGSGEVTICCPDEQGIACSVYFCIANIETGAASCAPTTC